MVERPGPDYLRNVDGIAGTDHGGLRRGSGLSLATRPDKDNYVHVSFPVTLGMPFEVQGADQTLFFVVWTETQVAFTKSADLEIFHLGYFLNAERFYAVKNLAGVSSVGLAHSIPQGDRRQLRNRGDGFGLSVGFRSSGDGMLNLNGASAIFEINVLEPDDVISEG
jgi:hypothetical protein